VQLLGQAPSDDWIERGLKPRRATNEFRGNDFQAAELLSVTFKGGIDIRAQRWPAGPEYITLDRLQERIRRARPIVGRWADDERAEAELMLEIYSTGGYEEQDELFAHDGSLACLGPSLIGYGACSTVSTDRSDVAASFGRLCASLALEPMHGWGVPGSREGVGTGMTGALSVGETVGLRVTLQARGMIPVVVTP